MDTALTRMIKGLRGYKPWGEVKKIMFICIRIEEIKRGCDQGVQNPEGIEEKMMPPEYSREKLWREWMRRAGGSLAGIGLGKFLQGSCFQEGQ